jgi:hypothetical protein
MLHRGAAGVEEAIPQRVPLAVLRDHHCIRARRVDRDHRPNGLEGMMDAARFTSKVGVYAHRDAPNLLIDRLAIIATLYALRKRRGAVRDIYDVYLTEQLDTLLMARPMCT